MKNVYIVNECLSSAKNGIGTYLTELLYCLQAIGGGSMSAYVQCRL